MTINNHRAESDNVSLELAGSGRIPEIMPVMRAAFDSRFGEAWSESQCSSVLTLPGGCLGIARHLGMTVGFALWRAIAGEAELMLIAVDPMQQGKGIGQALVELSVTESRNAGAEMLHVEVRADNKALHFYDALGFNQVGQRPDYYKRSDGGPREAITLVLRF